MVIWWHGGRSKPRSGRRRMGADRLCQARGPRLSRSSTVRRGAAGSPARLRAAGRRTAGASVPPCSHALLLACSRSLLFTPTRSLVVCTVCTVCIPSSPPSPATQRRRRQACGTPGRASSLARRGRESALTHEDAHAKRHRPRSPATLAACRSRERCLGAQQGRAEGRAEQLGQLCMYHAPACSPVQYVCSSVPCPMP